MKKIANQAARSTVRQISDRKLADISPEEIKRDEYYVITEWDDSQETVQVRPFGDDVLMRYRDGTTHRVSRQYFVSLKPIPAQEHN